MAGDEAGDRVTGSGDTLVNADRAMGCVVTIGGGGGLDLRLLRSSGAIKNATSKLRFCGLWCSAAAAGSDVTCGATSIAVGGEYREGGDDDAVATFLC